MRLHPWDFETLSLNSKVAFDLVEEYPDRPWHLGYVLRTKNVSPEFLFNTINHQHPTTYLGRLKHVNSVDIPWTSPALLEPTREEVFDFVRKRHATRVICKAIMRALTDPRFEYCRRRLTKEFLLLTTCS